MQLFSLANAPLLRNLSIETSRIREVRLENCSIDRFPRAGAEMKILEVLKIVNTNLTECDVAILPALTELAIEDNPLSSLNFPSGHPLSSLSL